MKYIISIIALVIFTFEYSHAQRSSDTDSPPLFVYDILFELGNAVILEDSYSDLDSLFTFLVSNPTIAIEIGNHCDERASSYYSNKLTGVRAKAIGKYLIQRGIQSKRIETKGYEDTQPVIKNAKSEVEHSKNRRTEIRVLSLR